VGSSDPDGEGAREDDGRKDLPGSMIYGRTKAFSRCLVSHAISDLPNLKEAYASPGRGRMPDQRERQSLIGGEEAPPQPTISPAGFRIERGTGGDRSPKDEDGP